MRLEMKGCLAQAYTLLALLACLASACASVESYSFVILNRSSSNSLVRYDAHGQFVATIANGAGGVSFAKDRNGNYIVAAVGSLLRVTPAGTVTTIAKAPARSQWIYVLQEPEGSFLVADNVRHAIWRVSDDGQTTIQLLDYPAPSPNVMENASIAPDRQGSYLLLEENGGARLFRFTPTGTITPIQLNRSMRFCWGLATEEPESYLTIQPYVPVAEETRGTAFLRVAPTGELTELARSTARPNAAIRDPETSEFIAISNYQHKLMRISTDGRAVITLANDQTHLPFPEAILTDAAR
jgi:sugar lactone lactonase YvrE